MMEGEFDEQDMDVLRTVIARLGVADLRAFGLTWDDCEEALRQLGYSARVEHCDDLTAADSGDDTKAMLGQRHRKMRPEFPFCGVR